MTSHALAVEHVLAETRWPLAREHGRSAPIRMFDDRDGCSRRIVGISPDLVVAEFLVPGKCRIFSGHYPEFPLLPGVFMIEAALQAVEMAPSRSLASRLVLNQLSNIQLLQAIVPDQWVNVEASRIATSEAGPASTWRARLTMGSRRVASCTLAFAEALLPTPATPDSGPSISQCSEYRLSAADIVTRLAHRSPILLVDQASRANDGQSLRAQKAITLNEPCYAAVATTADESSLSYPQTLMIESFVQAAGLLLLPAETGGASADSPLMIFGGLGGCRFHGHALPGETLTHQIHLTRRINDMAVLGGTTFSDGRLLAQFSGLIVAMKPREDLMMQPVSTRPHRIA